MTEEQAQMLGIIGIALSFLALTYAALGFVGIV